MILITGGAGYIGSHVNKLLNSRGYKTVIFDNLVYGHREFVKWGEFVQGDLADRAALEICFSSFPIHAVMHFGAYAYVGESMEDPLKYYRNNVANTLNLLSVMKDFGVGRIVFSSTCAVYGTPLQIPIKENNPCKPINPYGRTKLMVENILDDFSVAYGMNYICLRYFNAAGADSDAELGEWHDPEPHIIPLVLDVASGRRPNVMIYGTDYDTPDGTCIRDYIHVTDLSEAHVLALQLMQREDRSDIFNLGNGGGYSVRQVIDTASEVTGREIRVVEGQRRPGDPSILIGSAERARDILKWNPVYPDLRSIIGSAWKWHQKLR